MKYDSILFGIAVIDRSSVRLQFNYDMETSMSDTSSSQLAMSVTKRNAFDLSRACSLFVNFPGSMMRLTGHEGAKAPI